MEYNIEGDSITVIIHTSLYPIEVIFKCIYWYTAFYNVNLKTDSPGNVRVIFHTKDPDASQDLQSLPSRLKRDLIDCKLRSIVLEETKNIRELLIAKAFSNYEINETPTGEISDPVGFDPINSI